LLAWMIIIAIWVFAGVPLGFDGPRYLSGAG
jgi:p-aminobenzoyl-glutamate transporter AbgT